MRLLEEVSVGAHASRHVDCIPVETFEIVDGRQALGPFLSLLRATEGFREHLAVGATACQQRPVDEAALEAIANQVLSHGDYRAAR